MNPFVSAKLTNVSCCLTIAEFMAARRTLTFRIDDDLVEGLHVVWERDGVAVSEQIRRAIRTWLESRGVAATPKSKRGKPLGKRS
jgi:hypothetical protein